MGRHGVRVINGYFHKEFTKSKYYHRELGALRKMRNHPFVTDVIESFQHDVIDGKFYGKITMIYCRGCDLHSWIIDKPDGSSLLFCKYYFKKLLIAYHYAKSRHIWHRDIKPENIMIDLNGVIKLIDWELSTNRRYNYQRVGTEQYMSEETHLAQFHDCEQSDVWSMGVTLFAVAIGQRPYGNIFSEIINGVKVYDEWLEMIFYKQWERFWRLMEEKHNSKALKNRQFRKIIQCMLQKDPSKRIKIEDLMEHDFFLNDDLCRSELMQQVELVSHTFK